MKKIVCYLCILSVLFFSGCGQAQNGVNEDAKDILKNAELTESVEESTQESKADPEGEKSGITLSVQGWEIINRVDKDLPEGYEEVLLSYMNASDFGVDCYEEVWSSKEEEKQLPIPAYMTDISDEVYRNLITELLETDMPMRGWWPYDTSYVILDIDEDGREELILNGANAGAMATMAYHIYDYDRDTGDVYLEFACWPDVDFLDNGYVKEEASRNHGRSDLEDFWPYHLLVYNAETDQYDTVAQIDAWQKELYPEGFPDEADKDGDGIVYYTADVQFWTPTAFMDKAEYDIWCEQYNAGTAKKIQWKTIMTFEDYEAIYKQNAVG